MSKVIKSMFENGIFEQRYKGIIEIHPHKVTNNLIFDAALLELQKDYDLYQMFPGWIRAFKKRTQTHRNAP